MNLSKYPVITDNKHLVYEFLSVGSKGIIKKIVFYQEIVDNVFNLGFGDWDDTNQKVSDKIRSNNNDRDKVLATVAFTVIDFIKHHPQACIFVEGSTPGRTRLYQMGVLANWNDIVKWVEVQGNFKGSWEPFAKKRNYQAFLFKAK